jgi:hypothetical protein
MVPSYSPGEYFFIRQATYITAEYDGYASYVPTVVITVTFRL